MGTAVTQVNIPALPAHLQKYNFGGNASAIAGINAASWARISIGGSKFSITDAGTKTLITDPANPQLPKMQLELVVVGHNPSVSKLWYDGDFVEGEDREPDCSSDDGRTPDSNILNPPSPSCPTCPKNAWGSAISKGSGKPIKACSDQKRLVVIPAHDLSEAALDLSIKPASLKEWANYVRGLDSRGIPVEAVVTLVFFDPSANFPKLMFKFGRYLEDAECAKIAERAKGDDVRLIASPRRTIPIAPAAPQTAAVATPTPHASPVVQAPAVVAPVVDPYTGLPDYVKQAVNAVGGLGSAVGDGTFKTLTGRDPPGAAAPQAPAAAPPPPPPPAPPVDPFEGQPIHVKPAVTAAGGLGTEGGNAVWKSLTGKDSPVAKRGRGRPGTTKAAEPNVNVAPPATTTAPAPAAQTFATGPTATPDNLGAAIEDLLEKAMQTPTTT